MFILRYRGSATWYSDTREHFSYDDFVRNPPRVKKRCKENTYDKVLKALVICTLAWFLIPYNPNEGSDHLNGLLDNKNFKHSDSLVH